MNVSLTPELEKLVRKKVDSGLYNSASEVIREALRLLEEQDCLRAVRLEALRQKIQQGFESSPGAPLDFEEIKRRGRERLSAAKDAEQ